MEKIAPFQDITVDSNYTTISRIIQLVDTTSAGVARQMERIKTTARSEYLSSSIKKNIGIFEKLANF